MFSEEVWAAFSGSERWPQSGCQCVRPVAVFVVVAVVLAVIGTLIRETGLRAARRARRRHSSPATSGGSGSPLGGPASWR